MEKVFEIELPVLPHPSNYGQAEKAQIGLVLSGVASMARGAWIDLAKQRLNGRPKDSNDYVMSIQDPEILPGIVTISLVGKRAQEIEWGRASYDLRDVLLNPKYVPVKRRGQSRRGMYRSAKTGGFYRPISFRHGGPDTQGTVGTPMGSQFAALKVGAMTSHEAKDLGHAIYKAAKQLRASTEGPNRKTQWGERLIAGLAPKLRPHHVTDIFAGMTKVGKQYDRGPGSKYITFRTISTNKKTGWIMPATQGYHILAALKGHMAANAPSYVSSIIGALPSAASPPLLGSGS